MSTREGESERDTLLRILEAPLSPALHPDRPAEPPNRKRARYLGSNRGDVSDPDVWHFVHGATVDAESTYKEAVESEEASDSDFSLGTDQVGDEDPHQPEKKEEYLWAKRPEGLFLVKSAINFWTKVLGGVW